MLRFETAYHVCSLVVLFKPVTRDSNTKACEQIMKTRDQSVTTRDEIATTRDQMVTTRDQIVTTRD